MRKVLRIFLYFYHMADSTNIKGIALPELQFILTTAGNDYILPNAPKGWEKILVKLDRDKEYYASRRTYSVPMDFVLDGAFLLREQFYQYGVQANARLTINQLEASSQTYVLITRGDIDFSEVTDSKDIFTANLMDAGIESKIKAYHNVTYEFDMADGFDLELTPLSLEETAILIFIPTTDFRSDAYFGLNVINNEQLSVNSSVKNSGFYADSYPNFDSGNNNYFYKATTDTDIRIKGSIGGSMFSFNNPRNYQINVYRSDGVLVQTVYQNNLPDASITPFNVEFDFVVPMLAEQRLFWYFERIGSVVSTEGFQIGAGTLELTYNTTSPSSTIKAFRPKQLFDKLIAKMNGSAYPTASYHLDTTWVQLAITSGDAIRGITNPKLKTSWDDFWQSIDAQTNAMFGDNNGVATLEAKSNAYKRALPIFDVGEVKDFELSPYTEIMASNITVGYEDETLDVTGGRTVVASTQKYTTPLTRVQKELQIVSKYRSADIEIELLRVRLDGKDSTDNSADNKCYFVYVKDTPVGGKYQPEGVEGFTSVTGVQEGSYNIKLYPKQMLYRWSDYLSGMLNDVVGGQILFASAAKDVTPVTVSLTGVRIAERDNVQIIALGAPLFLPKVVTFKCKLPINAIFAAQTAPNGYVNFSFANIPLRGFNISMGIDAAHNSEQQFTLLLTPDNNLMGLVK